MDTEAAPASIDVETKVPGIGDVARDALRNGASNQAALDAVRVAFPDGKTTMASINWYRNDLRRRGEKVPTSNEAKAANDPPTAAAHAEADPSAVLTPAQKRAAKKAADKLAASTTATQEVPAGELSGIEHSDNDF